MNANLPRALILLFVVLGWGFTCWLSYSKGWTRGHDDNPCTLAIDTLKKLPEPPGPSGGLAK